MTTGPNSPKGVAPARHDAMLDVIRGLAAEAVVVGHACSVVFPASSANIVLGWCSYIAVLVFFVLSGYVIVGSLLREAKAAHAIDYRDFAIRRVARIMPPYLLTLLLVFVFFLATPIGHQLSDNYNLSIASAVRSAVFAFTSRDAIVLTPVWSLRLEVGLYIFAALGLAVLLSRGWKRACLAGVFVLLVVLYCWKLTYAVTAIATFGLGAILATRFEFVDRDASWVELALARIGSFSYTLYLVHMPIIWFAFMLFPGAGKAFGFWFSVFCANAFAWGAALLVERPRMYAAILRDVSGRFLVRPA